MKKNKCVTRIAIALVSLFMLINVAGCGENVKFMKDSDLKAVTTVKGNITLTFDREIGNQKKNFTVQLPIVLDYKKAPITVTNFVSLVQNKFYDAPTAGGELETSALIMDSLTSEYASLGLKYFEKTKDDKGVISSAPSLKSKSSLKDAYQIVGEFKKNGWEKNDIEFTTGTLYMTLTGAEKEQYNTAYCQFGIIDKLDTTDAYKEKITAFGKVDQDNISVVDEKQIVYNWTLSELLEHMESGFSTSEIDSCVRIIKITVDSVDLGKVWKLK